MSTHFKDALLGEPNRYVHAIPYHEICRKADELKALHARTLDVAELDYEHLAHQLLVRDLRRTASGLAISDYLSSWNYDPLLGSLQVVFAFGSEADMVHFVLRVG